MLGPVPFGSCEEEGGGDDDAGCVLDLGFHCMFVEEREQWDGGELGADGLEVVARHVGRERLEGELSRRFCDCCGQIGRGPRLRIVGFVHWPEGPGIGGFGVDRFRRCASCGMHRSSPGDCCRIVGSVPSVRECLGRKNKHLHTTWQPTRRYGG